MKCKVDKRAANSKHAELPFLPMWYAKNRQEYWRKKKILAIYFLAFSPRLTPFRHCQKTNKKATLQNTRFFLRHTEYLGPFRRAFTTW